MSIFSTGEVAKRLNVSLRTIRYYDQIGLVEPAIKEENGKRFFTREDILRLQKVLLLKATSMSLKDIQKVIDQISIQNVLEVHKEQLEFNLKQVKDSLNHTNTLINTLKLEGNMEWEYLLPLLSEDKNTKEQVKKGNMAKLFTDDEQTTLNERLPKMETDSNNVRKWINLIKRVELCLKEGKMPFSEEGKLIAEDTLILSNETFNGDTELEEKFWEARRSKETSTDLNLYPLPEEVTVFMEEAIDYLNKEGENH